MFSNPIWFWKELCSDFIMVHIGIRPQVAAVEQSTAEVAKNVEAPVVIVTGGSRGIGKAIALAMGKAGCKVNDYPFIFFSNCHYNDNL